MNSACRRMALCLFSLIFYSGFSDNGGFIENKGQIFNQDHLPNKDVLFLYDGKDVKIQLRRSGYSYEWTSAVKAPVLSSKNKTAEHFKALTELSAEVYRVDMDFQNAQAAEVVASEKSEDVLNYFMGDAGFTGIHSYKKVTYKNIYPNTDIEFILGDERCAAKMKYNIILRPGADIEKVKILCKGFSDLDINEEGKITIKTPLGELQESIPYSFYDGSPLDEVKISYHFWDGLICFSGNYDHKKTLVIDPSSDLIWGTYYGDSGLEFCTGSASDASNNVYITGYTFSSSNIATNGTYQNTIGGSFDAFIAKFNSAGVRQWGTYLGGSNVEASYGICVDATGNIYMAGAAVSTSSVASSGAHQTVYGGGINDGLLAKFNPAGQLSWCTYYGGSMHDIVSAVCVDPSGNVIIAGHSESNNNIATNGSYNNVYLLNYDAFIAKFNPAGVRQWGTYYGDTGIDEAYGVDCDASGNIYITGLTTSLNSIATGTGHQQIIGGGQDAFVAKFDPSGVNLLWGTYYGGTGTDNGTAIEINANGIIFAGGATTSPGNIASAGSYQTSQGSLDDAFIVAFNGAGVRQWGTYFGGNDVDYIFDLESGPGNDLLFSGHTLSPNQISTTGAYQTAISTSNFYDACFGKFSQSGKLKLASYFGGPDSETGNGIALDNTGKLYMCGETSSTSSISTNGAHMTAYSAGGDMYLAKFCLAPEPVINPAGTSTFCVGSSYTLSAQPGYSTYLWSNGSTTNPMTVSNATFAATYNYTVYVTDGFGCDAYSDTVKVIINQACSVYVAEKEYLKEIILYPNPAINKIQVEMKNIHPDKIKWKIFNSLGEIIMEEETRDETFSADISALSCGIYFLEIQFDDQNIRKKFVKQ